MALFVLLALLGLGLRSQLPTIVPDLARPHGRAVQLESARGALSAAQSTATAMTLCPIAIAVTCRKCPIVSACPVKTAIGDRVEPKDAKPAVAKSK